MTGMARFLGIDGGGSSTRVLLIDETGKVLFRGQGGPSNLLVVGQDRARDAVLSILPQDEPVDAIVAGLAGADRPAVQRFWMEVLTPCARVRWVVGDYRIAWAALTEGASGLIIITGTGSIVYAEHGDKSARIGGYGWLIGDAGSGLALGREAIEAVLAEAEGWGPATALSPAVSEWAHGTSPMAILNHVYDKDTDWRSPSDLAHQIFIHADADSAAKAILMRHRDIMLRYVTAAINQVDLPDEAPVGLAGGLARMWHPHLEKSVFKATGRRLVLSQREPVEGAAWLARLWHTNNRGELI